MKPLGEIVKILKGGKAPEVFDEPRPGAYPYLQIEDLRPDANPKYAIDKDGILATKADVLIAWDGANAGTIGFDLEGYIGSTIAILRPTHNDIYAPYLGYFLRSKFNEIQNNTTGATIPHVNRGYLENLQLPIPPLSEQRRIAALLARTDHLRRLRRYADALSASLLQSVFLEMFGDPASNPMGWEKTQLVDVLDVITYGLTVRPEYIENGIPLISAREIRSGFVDFFSAPRISETDFSNTYDKGKPQKGDVLFSKTGTIGHCAEVTTDKIFAISQNVARLGFKRDHVINAFAIQYLRTEYFQKIAKEAAKGNAVQDLQLGVMQRFLIYLPPLPEQERFARLVRRVEALRRRQAESARQGEALFKAMLNQSFGG